ncbi:hypothetical protein [Streptomyces sp. st140]|uniref:hypothetical protein n=1 Tax=Streptomyces sp. st140 TaxID=1828052 RepID=UPI00211D3945|nr:hypothetical protein [Streptomyces sp. st140]
MIGRIPVITFVTLGELTQWAEIRDWDGLATLNLKDYAYFKDHHRLRILGEQ